MGSPADQQEETKALTFETAQSIQQAIEQLPGAWSSHLVSLADRNPSAYRVELYLGGLGGQEAAAFQKVADDHGATLRIAAELDRGPAYGILVRFDKLRRAL